MKNFEQAIQVVTEAYRKGEYESGLQLAEKLKRARSTPPVYWLFRGRMLYQLGQLKEAEYCLRRSSSMETEPRRQAPAREALGKVLMEQKQYDEAIANFEACMEACPASGSGHRALAEAWLRKGIRAGDALGSARLAVKIARTERARTRYTQSLNLAEALATLAWAVAAHSSDAAEVERLLEEAFPLCGDEYRQIRAHLHCMAAAAYSALGTAGGRERSADHLQQAAAADPQGTYGRRAAALLEAAV